MSTSGSPATSSVRREWQTFGRNDANAEHDACHVFGVAFLPCKLLFGTGASKRCEPSQPWPLSWAHVSIQRSKSKSVPCRVASQLSNIVGFCPGQRQKRVQWKLVAAIPISDTYVAYVVLAVLGLPLEMFFDLLVTTNISSTPYFSQVQLASCSASCRSPLVEVWTPRVGESRKSKVDWASVDSSQLQWRARFIEPWTDIFFFSFSH